MFVLSIGIHVSIRDLARNFKIGAPEGCFRTRKDMTHIGSYQIDSISCALTVEVMKLAPGFFKCPVSKVMLHECQELKSFKTKNLIFPGWKFF